MKTIMYGSGTEGRFGYFGPAEGQMSLTYFDDVSVLKDFLLRRFAGRTLIYRNVRYETLMETEFVAKHYRKAIKELYEENKVHIEGMGKRSGLPDNARITFK